MSASKRMRTSYYSVEDTLRLIDLVNQYKHITENKRQDAVTSSEKTNAWNNIAVQYNSQTTVHRTGELLRQKFDHLKKLARKYAAAKRQERLQTGGGPSTMKMDLVLEKVLDLIKVSAEGNESHFDSDSLTFTVDQAQDDINGSISIIHMEPLAPSVEEEVDLPGCSSVSWNKYTPNMLRSQLHPAIAAQLSQSVGNSSSSGDSGMTESALNTAETETLSATRPIVEEVTSSPNIRRRKSPQLSASGRNLQPWVRSKTLLTQNNIEHQKKKYELELKNMEEMHTLQLKIEEKKFKQLDEDNKRKEEREEELHKLKKESLSLDIEIKKETLRKLKNS